MEFFKVLISMAFITACVMALEEPTVEKLTAEEPIPAASQSIQGVAPTREKKQALYPYTYGAYPYSAYPYHSGYPYSYAYSYYDDGKYYPGKYDKISYKGYPYPLYPYYPYNNYYYY